MNFSRSPSQSQDGASRTLAAMGWLAWRSWPYCLSVAVAVAIWCGYGVTMFLALVSIVCACSIAWATLHRKSFARASSYLRFRDRTIRWRKSWRDLAHGCNLTSRYPDSRGRLSAYRVPKLGRIRRAAFGASASFELLPGQTAETVRKASPALAHGFRALHVTAQASRPGYVQLDIHEIRAISSPRIDHLE